MKLSLCMIVKNEEEYIERCLESVLSLVDEAIIVDTGSTDSTVSLVKKYGNKIKLYFYEWKDNFADARNFSLKKASGEWIIIVDADEVINYDKSKLYDLLDKTKFNAYAIPIYNYTSTTTTVLSSSMVRLYKNGSLTYRGVIHEQPVFTNPDEKYSIVDEAFCKIHHYGYLPDVIERKEKLSRNLKLIELEVQRDPLKPFNWYNLGNTYVKSRKPSEALDCFLKTYELCGNTRYTYYPQLILKIAQCLWTLRHSQECKEFIESRLIDKELSLMPDLYYYLGLSYIDLIEYDRAIECFQKCLIIGHSKQNISIIGVDSYLPLIEWGKILVKQGRIDESIVKLKEAVLYPDNSSKLGMNELIELLEKNNRYSEIDELYELYKTTNSIESENIKISLCMIVKDEERYIKKCLDNAIPLVDEVILVDTGSKDETIEIIKSNYGDKVKLINHIWEQDFSKARNVSLENATGDWILVLDADEKINCNIHELKKIISEEKYKAYRIPIYNFTNPKTIVFSACMVRLFKNMGARYKGAIHEQIMFNNEQIRSEILDENVCKIFHYGYMQSTFKEKNKHERNYGIIKSELNKNPEHAFSWYNLGVHHMSEKKFQIALDNFIKAHELCKGIRHNFHNDLVLRMTQCMWALKQYRQCKNFLVLVLRDSQLCKLPDLHYYLGYCNKELKLFEEAVENYKECLSIGDVSKNVSHLGMGSFYPLIEWANILIMQNRVGEGVMKYMEAVFHPKNFAKQGLDELIGILKKYNMHEVLSELDKVLTKNKVVEK